MMTVLPSLTHPGSFTVNPRTASELGIQALRRAYLKFGNRTCEAKPCFSTELKEHELLIDIDIIKKLNLGLYLQYELTVSKNAVILGPYIGILASRTSKALNEIVDTLKNYVYDYAHIGGAVLAFSLDKIDKNRNRVGGYLYNPQSDGWVQGVFPFPCAVFKLIGVNKPWRAYLNEQTGNRVFNDRIIGKWQAYCLLSEDTALKAHLPVTALYNRPKDVRQFLSLFGEAYIKNIYGSQGKGIVKICKRGKWYATNRADNGGGASILKCDMELNEFLKGLSPKQYIIQQAVDLLAINGQKIDFRLITVKDDCGVWRVVGTIARFGATGSIVSNISSGGSAQVGYRAMIDTMELSHKQAYLKIAQMEEIALGIGDRLDKSGCLCGNLGVDLALDTDGHIWIIEVNNKNPNHTIAIDAKNRAMFYKAKLDSMLYAKFLNDFGRST